MSVKKRDLEIVFNLLWNHRPLNADDRCNIVGMYDIPSTTLTWENFKSYLLKNSGSSSADIKVTYIDSDDKEITINSQEQFLLAMYSFRKRARIGDIITLKLDKATPGAGVGPALKQDKAASALKKKEAMRNYWNVPDVAEPVVAEEPVITPDADVPPEWFLKYMKKFKREIVEDMSLLVSRNISKLASANQSHSSRKTKPETHKKPRKLSAPTQAASSGHIEELKKYIKFESKLEKLEQKSLKIKAKKLALKVKEVGPSSKSRLIGLAPSEAELYMNATPVEFHMPAIPRMLGGETYLQQWKVINSGELPWTTETELRFAWGSKQLIPLERKVLCPHLLPGEEGVVSVLLEIPVTPGSYECYWHFHHNGERFGHWLGCVVIVDEPPIKQCHSPKQEFKTENALSADTQKDLKPVLNHTDKLNIEPSSVQIADVTSHMNVFRESIDLLDKLNSNNSSRSSSVSNEGYVFVDNEDKHKDKDSNSEEDIEKVENEEKKESDENNEERGLDIDENIAPEYAYIVYNGEKFPFHKKFLTDEYFQKAEKVQNLPAEENMCGSTSAPNLSSVGTNAEEPTPKQRNVSESSSTRLFVFPQHSPGFEVVYPDDMKDQPDSFVSFDSNMMACNSSTNGQSNPDDSRMSSSRNSLLVNTDSQSACPCNVSQTCLESSFQYNPGDCECNYCGPRECSSAPCPYKVEQHIYAGCTSRSCNVQMSSSPPKNPTPPQSATDNVFGGESGSNTNCTTPQMSESVHSGRSHVHRPPHVWNSRPENLITGAAILASSAMSTARSMMNMVIQNGGGKWVNGHWVVDNPNSKRENGLRLLAEMGFLNRDLNATLMARYNDDVHRVISELIL